MQKTQVDQWDTIPHQYPIQRNTNSKTPLTDCITVIIKALRITAHQGKSVN